MFISAILSTLLLQQNAAYQAPKSFCQLDSPDVSESSGIAESRQYPGTFYTHNDSGDKARFFRFNASGEVDDVFSLEGIEALDWEDMAIAKQGNRNYLYFGDIGDNAEKRKSILVHRVEEPSIKAKGTSIDNILTMELTYPDSPQNCETLLVDGPAGTIYLVTKNPKGQSQIYSVKIPKKSGKLKLEKIGGLNFQSKKPGGVLVTGGAISLDGKKVVLRTYSDIFEYQVTGKMNRWFVSQPKIWAAPLELQGEAITYRTDGSGLITSSEGLPCPITFIPKG